MLCLLFVTLFKDALINMMVRRLPTTLQTPTLVLIFLPLASLQRKRPTEDCLNLPLPRICNMPTPSFFLERGLLLLGGFCVDQAFSSLFPSSTWCSCLLFLFFFCLPQCVETANMLCRQRALSHFRGFDGLLRIEISLMSCCLWLSTALYLQWEICLAG